jgi:hypothetical protein
LIVDYLRERQPSLDFASIDAISRTLAGLFWARIEALAPGIDTLRLPLETVRAWKEDLSTKKRTTTNAAGEQIEISSPRINAKDELLRVRACYLDIAQWAVDDPGRWAPWAVLCPISDAEIGRVKELKHPRPAWTSAPANGYPSCLFLRERPTNAASPQSGGCEQPWTPSPQT